MSDGLVTPTTTPVVDDRSWFDVTRDNVTSATAWVGERLYDVMDLTVVAPTRGLIGGAVGGALDQAPVNVSSDDDDDDDKKPRVEPWVVGAVVGGAAVLAAVAAISASSARRRLMAWRPW